MSRDPETTSALMRAGLSDAGDGKSPQYLLGMARVKDKIKMLLDMERVLVSPEVNSLDALLQ